MGGTEVFGPGLKSPDGRVHYTVVYNWPWQDPCHDRTSQNDRELRLCRETNREKLSLNSLLRRVVYVTYIRCLSFLQMPIDGNLYPYSIGFIRLGVRAA